MAYHCFVVNSRNKINIIIAIEYRALSHIVVNVISELLNVNVGVIVS